MSARSHGLAVLVICIIKSIVFPHQGNRQMLLIERKSDNVFEMVR